MYNAELTMKLKERFLSQSQRDNAKGVIKIISSLEQDLSKNIWDFDFNEFKIIVDRLENKDKAKNVISEYIEYAICQGYTISCTNNFELMFGE